MRELSKNFIKALTKGNLAPLLERVKLDTDLDLEIREGYINIYFKGNNLLKLNENFSFKIDKKFTEGITIPPSAFSTKDICRYFVEKAFPLIKEKIISTKTATQTLEIEYEQLLIRTNNYTRNVNSEYFIVDRHYAKAGEKIKYFIDLFGVFSDRKKRIRSNIVVAPFLAEVKYSLNPDIRNIYHQIEKYYRQISKDYGHFINQVEVLLHQKSKLGLIEASYGLIKKFKSATVDKDIKNLRILIVLIDYNPNSTMFSKDVINKIKGLEFSDQIYIFKAGFAMWKQNVQILYIG